MSLLRRRAWLLLEIGVILVGIAIWWFFFWSPGQARKHDALNAFDAYTATMPATWRDGRDVVTDQDSSYLVCSRRDEVDQGIQHLCLSINTDLPKAQRVVGGYKVATIGYDLPTGTKTDCFGRERGECVG
jgi:plastocyanin domain-containing protein